MAIRQEIWDKAKVMFEAGFHSIFHKKRARGEWFNLSKQDVDFILAFKGDFNG